MVEPKSTAKLLIFNDPQGWLWSQGCEHFPHAPGCVQQLGPSLWDMKPKPHSIQHRFILLQATTFGLAVWFLASALYVNLKIRREMEEPLQDLHAALALNSEIEATQEELMMALGEAYFHPGESPNAQFQVASRKLTELTERYRNLHLSREERYALQTIRLEQERLLDRASQKPRDPEDIEEALRQIWQARKINQQIVFLLHDIGRTHLQRLDASTERLREFTRTLYLLLAGFGAFASLALLQFRRVHKREIWGPLEGLRRMVVEIRRGNLNPDGRVPESIEFGTLMQGFLDMAGELREMRDSLEQKVRERTAQLEAAHSELIQAAKLSSLGQLVSGVAHEINNPLTSILGFSELALSQPGVASQLRAPLQTIRNEALRLKNVVANLSSFARRGPQHTALLDLREVLNRLMDLRRYQLFASNIALHYDRPAAPVWVTGERDHLVQVIFNLVLNAEQAIQSCRARGDIWLACGVEAGCAWASVRDNGAGMSPAVRQCIFDPFFTTKSVGEGTGLGLSISHGIIRQHRGAIVVESVEGRGTTMRISLPLADPPKESSVEPLTDPAERVVAGEVVTASGLCALVIDDEPVISELVGDFLESRGWRHTSLNDPTAVEANLELQQFDLVICDLKMPGRNGLEVLRLLRQMRPELARRFLLMTGNIADTAEKQSDELAGVPILRKPFTLAALAEAVRALAPVPK